MFAAKTLEVDDFHRLVGTVHAALRAQQALLVAILDHLQEKPPEQPVPAPEEDVDAVAPASSGPPV
jgi:hypothetical protein